MKSWNEMLSFMPEKVRSILKNVLPAYSQFAEEVRLRAERPLVLITKGKPNYLDSNGVSVSADKAYRVTVAEISDCLRLLSHSSLYAWEEELRQGFVTVKGGHRVGLAGRVLTEKGSVRGMKDISSLNFRLAREIHGCGKSLADTLLAQRPVGTLLIAPPRGGKTTLLRDLIRLTSLRGHLVCVVDERSEIAACWQGIPQKDLGPNTDVLDACPKAEGMMLMIRSLGPEIIAVDEIGRQEDAEALFEAAKAGVAIYATVHATDLKDAMQRPILRSVIGNGIFEKIVVLDPSIRGKYFISDFPKELKVC